MEAANGTAVRLTRLEQDVTEIRVELRDYGAMKERVSSLTKEVSDLSAEVASLRKALIIASLSVSGSAVVFAFSIFQVG